MRRVLSFGFAPMAVERLDQMAEELGAKDRGAVIREALEPR